MTRKRKAGWAVRLHYKGKYDLDPASLPHGEHRPGAVKFREAADSKALGRIANGLALGLLAIFGLGLYLRCGREALRMLGPGACLAMLSPFPHELLHAVCFREDVYLYTNWKQGMLFVVGPEDMSRGRFVFMSLLPNLAFGFVPYVLAMVWPHLALLGSFGLTAITMGAGDYYNVYNALTQMPRGARTYLYQFNSWWYLPG